MGKMTEKHKRVRRADSRDAEVGRRVRSRRLERRLSQTELADGIGVTFQQVQKYEKGRNRIGAGRLERISEKLGVPISFFFDNMEGTSAGAPRDPTKGKDSVFELMQTSDAVRIVKSFHRIKSRQGTRNACRHGRGNGRRVGVPRQAVEEEARGLDLIHFSMRIGG